MNYQIIARRWFDKKWGNTYFSSEIYINNELIHKIDFEYGYGNHCIDQSIKYLKENNLIDLKNEHISEYEKRTGNKILQSITDVSRKKDL